MTSAEPRNSKVGHDTGPVKPTNPAPGQLRRHLEGWQLAVVAVAIALLGAALAVPRSEPPEEVPVPHIDRLEERRASEAEESLADAAEREPLPFEVRAVGELVRRYGVAEAAHDGSAAEQRLQELRDHVRVARAKHGDEGLLRLRAVQSRLFRKALQRWERSAGVDTELTELSGGFVAKARRSGWLDGERRLVLDEGQRALVFRIRWSELSGLGKVHPFRPSANEWRGYYRFLLEHPDVPAPGDVRDRSLAQLRYVQALERIDPDFPAAFAHGVLSYKLGQHAEAAQAFRAHLDAHPHGPWRLRAQNHLIAALEAVGTGQP